MRPHGGACSKVGDRSLQDWWVRSIRTVSTGVLAKQLQGLIPRKLAQVVRTCPGGLENHWGQTFFLA